MIKRQLKLLFLLWPAFSFASIQTCFTPYQDCERKIENLINHAQSSVYVQAYSFTSGYIAWALIHAANRGVKVRVIMDKSNFDPAQYSQAGKLMQHHIPVWMDYRLNIAHNKVMIIDKHIVETGSYNYTVSAQEHNAENVIIVDNKTIAATYLNNWQRREKVSKKMD